jgi:pimeloyl-ACP methyl ester carboxylesterase
MSAVPAATVLAFEGLDGIRLAGDRRGDPDAPPVLFLHGGGQTRHSWGGTADAVAERGWSAITLDARGHGESDWSDRTDYRLSAFAADVAKVIESLGEPPVLVGASLGGLTAILLLGELIPGRARGVVLVDIIPDMEQAGADRIQAFMAERVDEGFGSLDEVADAIATYNPHRPRPSDLSGLRKNLRERDGRFFWHWDPAFIGGVADLPPTEISDKPRLNADVQAIIDADIPVLLVRGRVSDLVSEQGAHDFCARFPRVEFVDVSGAGHMVAGDRNDAFTAAVVDFLDRHHPIA